MPLLPSLTASRARCKSPKQALLYGNQHCPGSTRSAALHSTTLRRCPPAPGGCSSSASGRGDALESEQEAAPQLRKTVLLTPLLCRLRFSQALQRRVPLCAVARVPGDWPGAGDAPAVCQHRVLAGSPRPALWPGSRASCQGVSPPLCTSRIPSRVPGAKLSCSRELFRSISGILLYQ